MYHDYVYYDTAATNGIFALAGIFLVIAWLISIAIGVFTIVCTWKVYKKAGKEGWESIIPVYNIIVLLEITELPMWYIALFFIPFANIYAIFKVNIELANKFGKSAAFGIGLVFLHPIFMAILAFSKDIEYIGVSNNSTYQNPGNTQVKFCTNCGRQVNPEEKYCTGCGNQL